MLEEIFVHILLSLFISGLMILFQMKSMDASACLLFGASVGLAGMIGAVIALLMSQLMSTSGGAAASALGIVGLLYLLRGGMDMSDTAVNWWNPMEWTYKTYPFTENNRAVLIPGFVFCAAVIILSFVLEKGRDLGAGYVPEMGSRKKVSRSLLSVHGFLFRINRGTIIGWLITLAVFGAMYGSIYGDMQSFLEGNDLLKTMFQMQGISIEASFTMTILMILAGLASIMPVCVVNRLYGEESEGRMTQIFATGTSRGKIYWTTVLIAACAGALALLACAAGLGGAAVCVMTTKELEAVDFIKAGMNYFPASLFMVGMAGVIVGYIPKWGKALYVYTAYGMLLNYFVNLMDLPEWVEKTAVLSWIPRMPVEKFDSAVFAGITAVSMILLFVGYLGYRRRDLQETV